MDSELVKETAGLNKESLRCERNERSRVIVHSVKPRKAWLTLTQASQYLQISSSTLRQAAEQQVLPFEHPLPDGPWIFQQSDLDSEAARKLVDRTRQRTKKRGAARSPNQTNLQFSET